MLKSISERSGMFAVMFAVTMAAALLPDMAHAAGGDTIGEVLCNVVGWFTGPVGKGIATLAIIVIGVGALMGKVSWGMAIIVGVGVAVIFGAKDIVEELGGGASGCNSSSAPLNR